jgi:hypothetical protein
LASGFGAIRWRFAVLGPFETIRVNGVPAMPRPERLELTGRPLSVQIVGGA